MADEDDSVSSTPFSWTQKEREISNFIMEATNPNRNFHVESGKVDLPGDDNWSLSTGGGLRTYSRSIQFQHPFSETPTVVAWLSGYRVTVKDVMDMRVSVSATDISPNSFFVQVQTWQTSIVDSVTVQWLSISSAVTDIKCGVVEVSNRTDKSHKLKTGTGLRSWEKTVPFQAPFFSGNPGIFFGFCTLDLVSNRSYRVHVCSKGSDPSCFTFEARTWSNSHVWGVAAIWIAVDPQMMGQCPSNTARALMGTEMWECQQENALHDQSGDRISSRMVQINPPISNPQALVGFATLDITQPGVTGNCVTLNSIFNMEPPSPFLKPSSPFLKQNNDNNNNNNNNNNDKSKLKLSSSSSTANSLQIGLAVLNTTKLWATLVHYLILSNPKPVTSKPNFELAFDKLKQSGVALFPPTIFQKGDFVAKGRHSKIYRGKGTQYQQHVGNVIIKEYDVEDAESVKAFLMEAHALQTLATCSQIINSIGFCINPLQQILHYYPKTLNDLIYSNTVLPWDIKLTILMSIMKGIRHMHIFDIVHRELNSFTILLDAEGHFKPVIAGMAISSFDTPRQQNTVWNSGDLVSGKPADVYSFGIIMYQLSVREQKPFVHDEPPSSFDLNRIQSAPNEVVDLIKRSTESDPNKRPKIFQIGNIMEKKIHHNESHYRVNITEMYKKKFQELVDATTISTDLNHGADIKTPRPPYSRLVVQKVERIEHPTLHSHYQAELEKHKNKSHAHIVPIKTPINDSSLITKKNVNPNYANWLEADGSINELYLWSGTQEHFIDKIIRDNFDPTAASFKGSFGLGAYFAEYISKADQYADSNNSGECFIFLCRVIMGHHYVTEKSFQANNNNQQFVRHGRDIQTQQNLNYIPDSVLAECRRTGFPKAYLARYREMIVYQKEQVYPEFLLTLKRV